MTSKRTQKIVQAARSLYKENENNHFLETPHYNQGIFETVNKSVKNSDVELQTDSASSASNVMTWYARELRYPVVISTSTTKMMPNINSQVEVVNEFQIPKESLNTNLTIQTLTNHNDGKCCI